MGRCAAITAYLPYHIRKTAPRFLLQLALAQLVDLEMGAVTAKTRVSNPTFGKQNFITLIST